MRRCDLPDEPPPGVPRPPRGIAGVDDRRARRAPQPGGPRRGDRLRAAAKRHDDRRDPRHHARGTARRPGPSPRPPAGRRSIAVAVRIVLRLLHVFAGIAVEPQHELRTETGEVIWSLDLLITGTRRAAEFDGGVHRAADVHLRDMRRDRLLARHGIERFAYGARDVIDTPDRSSAMPRMPRSAPRLPASRAAGSASGGCRPISPTRIRRPAASHPAIRPADQPPTHAHRVAHSEMRAAQNGSN